MRKLNLGLAGLGLLSLVSFFACQEIEPIDGIDYQAEFALPLVDAHVTIEDVLDATTSDLSFLQIGSDGSMKLSYSEDLSIELDKTVLEGVPDLTVPILAKNTVVPVNVFDEVQIKRTIFKSGNLSFAAASLLTENINITVQIPTIVKDGVPVELTGRILFGGSLPASIESLKTDLTGYEMQVVDDSLEVNYTATNDAGLDVELAGVLLRIDNWAFSYLQGIWGNVTYGVERDTLAFESYNDFLGGDLNLADPELQITVNNSVGFPVMADIGRLTVMTENNTELNLESSTIEDGIHLDYPKMNQVGESMETQITLNRDNSNIDAILNSNPHELMYQVAVLTNPPVSTTYEGFLTEDSKVELTLKADIPLYGSLTDLDFLDTLEADLSGLERFNEAEIKLIMENEIPLEAQLQVYFIDANWGVIDSLFDTHTTILAAAAVDGNGEVITVAQQETIISIPADRLDRIRTARTIILDARFATYNDGQADVRINTKQGLNVKIGVKAAVSPE